MNLPTWIEPSALRINRLRGYEVVNTALSALVERVKYDYYLDNHAAGNVAQIRHLTRTGETNDGTTTVTTYDAVGTLFEYNKMGEVWFAKHRTWEETHTVVNATGVLTVAPIGTGDVTTLDVVDFRGVGRRRHMVRHRETAWPHDPLYDSAVWTDYEGNRPLGDYSVTVTGQNPIVATQTAGQFYALGFAQADVAGEVMYGHGDHIGSTRAMSDSGGAVQRTFVYTAFGEPVDDTGTFDTRYQYAGKHGYESFGSFGLDFPFPYIHTGARWYDPGTGRFLQRDPIGPRGGLNVYAYVANSPTGSVDPFGLQKNVIETFDCQDACALKVPMGCQGYILKMNRCMAECTKKLVSPAPPAPAPPAPAPPAPGPPDDGGWNGKAISVVLMMLALAALLRESPVKGRAGKVQ